MPDTKITALAAITTVDPAADVLPIVDISDTSMAASGTTKKITSNQILGAGGTATLASATITGDLTVRTNKLKVDASGVGVGTTTTTTGGGAMVVEHASNNGLVVNSTAGSPTIYLRNTADANPAKLFFTDNGLTFANVTNGTLMTLNSTGLGVGNAPVAALDVYKVANDTINRTNATFCFGQIAGLGAALLGQQSASAPYQFNLQAANAANSVQFPLVLQPSGGNVGIGVTPSAWGAAYKAVQQQFGASFFTSNFGSIGLGGNCYNNGTNWLYASGNPATRYEIGPDAANHRWFIAPTGTINNAITFTQAMTLDASGNLLVGTPTLISNAKYSSLFNGNATYGIELKTTAPSGTSYFVNFFNSSTVQMGVITGTGTTVSYVTSSDYRLKEDVKPLTGALNRVASLKPSVYKWKADGSSGEGFLAHELAEVVPLAVNGEKDAVNEDGSVKPQGVDYSKVVPVLVAAIQELTARVQTLETR